LWRYRLRHIVRSVFLAWEVIMPSSLSHLALALGVFLCLGTLPAICAESTIARGKYLVQLGGCNDCHTPGYFFGKPDMSRYLGGSDVGFRLPTGTYVGPNLTPDNDTGLGKWSADQIITAFTKGTRPDGRMLADIMPWRALADLTPADAKSIAMYLKSLPPVSHKVPAPLGPDQKANFPIMTILAP
jgi:mono/diheme cytochrome c family protein